MRLVSLISMLTTALTLISNASAQEDPDLMTELWKTRRTPGGEEKILRQIEAATPKRRKALLSALLNMHDDGRLFVARLVAAASPEQRQTMLAVIVSVVQDTVKAPSLDGVLMASCAHVLREASDDNATLAAFGDKLGKLGFKIDSVAIHALSSCRDARAVEIMAEYARARMTEMKQWLPGFPPSASDEQKRPWDDGAISCLETLKALATSANSSGKTVARKLRDEFLKLFDASPYREKLLQGLREELDPLLQAASQTPSPWSPVLCWPVWGAVAAVLGFLGLLLWLMRRRTTKRANHKPGSTSGSQ